MYVDNTTSFMRSKFQLLNDILVDHSCTISQEWQVDLNDGNESLGFAMAGHTYVAHSLGPLGEKFRVSKSDFKFPHSDIMEAMGVVFPSTG
jgi:hypothetical protein